MKYWQFCTSNLLFSLGIKLFQNDITLRTMCWSIVITMPAQYSHHRDCEHLGCPYLQRGKNKRSPIILTPHNLQYEMLASLYLKCIVFTWHKKNLTQKFYKKLDLNFYTQKCLKKYLKIPLQK